MIYVPPEEGQGLTEYAIILLLVAIVLIAVVTIFGTQVSGLYSEIQAAIP